MLKKILIGLGGLLLLLVLGFAGGTWYLYKNQSTYTQKLLGILNESLAGSLKVEEIYISPFKNFPYISIDFHQVKVYEGDAFSGNLALRAQDIYVGFSIVDILQGRYDVKALSVEQALINMVQDAEGKIGLLEALAFDAPPAAEASEAVNFELKQLKLKQVRINYLIPSDAFALRANLEKQSISLKQAEDLLQVKLDGDMLLTLISKGEPTFFAEKALTLGLSLRYQESLQQLDIMRSLLAIDGAEFSLEGLIDLKNENYLDIEFRGDKPDFNTLAALLPKETGDQLRRYRNEGQVYFQGTVQGPTANGQTPQIAVEFGCDNAYFLNPTVNKKVDELRFAGFFTNGKDRNLATSQLTLQNFYARPAEGIFQGDVLIRNFKDPYIKVKLDADLDLAFLGEFFEVEGLRGLSGQVLLSMDFDELIDLEDATGGLATVQNALQSELRVRNLNFSLPGLPHPVQQANVYAKMEDGYITLERGSFRLGDSDLQFSGYLTDFPALLHGLEEPVEASLSFQSALLRKIDFMEMDTTDAEEVSDFNLKLRFQSSGRELVSPVYVPQGKFMIDAFSAKLKKYPHAFTDFQVQLGITPERLRVENFVGKIDTSDFAISGEVYNYEKWFQASPMGKSRFDLTVASKHLSIKDLLTYRGVNYMPEAYAQETIDDFKLAMDLELEYAGIFQGVSGNLRDFTGKLKFHPIKFSNFKGALAYRDDVLKVNGFGGRMGLSEFYMDLDYFLGPDSLPNPIQNRFRLVGRALDLDSLLGFESIEQEVNHEEAFNIFELPFPDLVVALDVERLKYHGFWLDDLRARVRMQEDHMLFIDTLSLRTADGGLGLVGYFNGQNPKEIYFHSTMKANKLDLDKLLIKFDNFGQDALINENLQGRLSGTIESRFLVHPDLTPIIEKSEAKMDLTVYEGSLIDFAPLRAMSSFFSDRNLMRVRFDTLQNVFELKNGTLDIPSMTIASSLGFIELSGRQQLDMQMDYFIRVPLGLVTSVGFRSLFGRNRGEVDPDQEDAIVTRGDRRVRFVNVNLRGTPDDFQVRLGRDRGR
ncbi:hypothetical protein A3SI_00380 [Nitritalea halalkaliphila LW7]|uniref:Uncharacterized protein n=1 Tax=Nitritalea halalkaliphila LW7 TaxID=1189621 RepID=I5CAM6_9BACT|nr:AsmA-like C-terminal region-containing protein [Nitritalea halalkaliphila]EIM78878.1 hypothetical protein A3SI_00380 [Nitritalea halalkaliphila LW7]